MSQADLSDLLERSHAEAWSPLQFDLSGCSLDSFSGVERRVFSRLIVSFLAGEIQVTEDLECLVPALRLLGWIDAVDYIKAHVFEEQRHAIYFRRLRDVLRIAPDAFDLREDLAPGELTLLEILAERLRTARERPDDLLTVSKAAVIYFLITEGCVGMTLFRLLGNVFGRGPFTVLAPSLRLLRADEARHVAFGHTLVKRLLGVQPNLRSYIHADLRTLLSIAKKSVVYPFAPHIRQECFGLDASALLRSVAEHFVSRKTVLD